MRCKDKENAVFFAVHPATYRGGGLLAHGVLNLMRAVRMIWSFLTGIAVLAVFTKSSTVTRSLTGNPDICGMKQNLL